MSNQKETHIDSSWLISKIIENLYKEGWLKKECDKICYGTDFNDDLFQEIVIILITYKNPELIIELYKKDQLKFFIKRIIYNQFNSSTSPFYTLFKKFRYNSNELFDDTFNGEGVEDGN